jgi:hypothetical protein
MDNPFETAIAALEQRLYDVERKMNEFRGAADAFRASINTLCEQAGLPPRYPDGGGGGSAPESKASATSAASAAASLSSIASDRFHGKRQATAVREYLEMRRAANLGPGKPREIYGALKRGGYQFTAKDDETALVGLRTTMRKNSVTFYKLPDGAYGLRAWYPHTKVTKAHAAGTEVTEGEAEPTEASPTRDTVIIYSLGEGHGNHKDHA